MNKLKILHVLTDTNIGGAGTLLVNYLHCFDREKYDIAVCLPRGGELIPLVEAEGYRVIELEHGRDKSFEMSALREYTQLFRREKPDIVHTHSAFSAKLAAYIAGVKSRIYTRHCAFEMPRRLTSFPGRQINGFINNTLATRIVAVAAAARDNLTETGVSEKKITVIINGVMPVREATADEAASLREKLAIADDAFVCGIPARLEVYKGHSYLIDTVAEVKKTHPEIVCIFMGRGSEEESLREQARRVGVEENIRFAGFVHDLAPYYAVMDLNLNCSWGTETSSLALSEGMSVGVPAVTTDFGGNPYMITEGVNGLIVPMKNSHAMAEAIERLIEDRELLARLGEGAREQYRLKFTAEAMTKNLEEIYDAEAARIGHSF